jgi:hypothetical protein
MATVLGGDSQDELPLRIASAQIQNISRKLKS